MKPLRKGFVRQKEEERLKRSFLTNIFATYALSERSGKIT